MNKLLKALIFNGEISMSVLDTTDMVNDAIKIQEETRLGPKRMQRLEAALKNYCPDLSFGMK